jgi:ferredoxin
MKVKVEFRNSKKTVEWADGFSSILDLARDAGVEIETDCEQGLCGTCALNLLSGEVSMETEDGPDEAEIEQNIILPCVSVHKTDVVLEV